ncbi:MAG TPA: GNAT family N-acetyltransferase [Actinopolymorphaceae bacterium]
MVAQQPSRYPAAWEADVVLRDGRTARLRPIRPDDADRLVAFYGRVSEESKYLRFFAPYPTLSPQDVARFTNVDHCDRVALILTVGEDMIAVGRYERTDPRTAEVAFLVQDADQGRGAGSVLLEHLAQAARENGIERFTAAVLPENRRMASVFREAGYQMTGELDDGLEVFALEIEPTRTSLDVMAAREQRAEARSVQRLLRPRSIAVIGASRSRDTVGQTLVRNLVLAGFTGPVYPVNPHAHAVAGVPAYPTVTEVPGDVELAVVAVPAPAVEEVVRQCAAKGVHGLVVVSSGFVEAGEEGLARQRELVRLARGHAMRVVGPGALGVVNTDPEVSLNASLAGVLPPRGVVGFFCQSGELGTVILQRLAERGLGLSSFVSAGSRADVSANDLMQYWIEDPDTQVVLLYLESIGNPRKFGRIARRLATSKPVVAMRTGRFTQGVPLGHAIGPTAVPQAAVDAMFQQAGVLLVDTLEELFDVAQVLAYQPLPQGGDIAVVSNSETLAVLATDAAAAAGLQVVHREPALPSGMPPDDVEAALRKAVADDQVHAVLVVYVSPLNVDGEEVAAAIGRAAAASDKPIVATFLGRQGVPEALRRYDAEGRTAAGSVPSYPTVEAAVRALAKATDYARWRAGPHGEVPVLPDIDDERARSLVADVLATHEQGTHLTDPQVSELLACYGIDVLPSYEVRTVEDAVATADRLGWDVVLKATAPQFRQRPDLADVWRNIDSEAEMREAWAAMVDAFGQPAADGFRVQKMAPPGVPVVVRCVEDRSFGPMVAFGVAGVATDLLGDLAYRVPPLTDVEAYAMIKEVRAAPLLFGHQGGDHADIDALAELLHRVGRLAADIPEVLSAELVPVLAGTSGVAVLGAQVRVGPADPRARSDWYARRLSSG